MQGSSRRGLTAAIKQGSLFTSASFARCNATASTAAATSSPSAKGEHPLFDFRRLRNRSAWKSAPPKDADYIDFPGDRLGDNIDLNWCICSYGVIPNNDLFRNLHVRGLQMFSEGKIDEHKAVHLKLDSQDETWQQFYIPPPTPPPAAPAQPAPAAGQPAAGQPAAAAPAPPATPPSPPQLFSPQATGKKLDPAQYKQLYKEVRKHISNSPNIFVQDGAVGSLPVYEEVSRFLTSDANTALFLRHFLPAVPFNPEPKALGESLVGYVAPGLKLSNPGDFGLQGNGFTVVDFVQHKIVLGGTRSPRALKEAIASLVTYQLAHKGVLPLNANSFLGADGKPVIVFGSSLNFARKDLFGSFAHLWSPVGVSKLFNGASTPYEKSEPLSRGDMIWTGHGQTYMVAPLKSVPVARHPSKFVFVTEGTKTELNKLPTDKAAERYTTSFDFPVYISTAVLKERFERALKENNVPVFELSVNSKSKDPVGEAKALLQKN